MLQSGTNRASSFVLAFSSADDSQKYPKNCETNYLKSRQHSKIANAKAEISACLIQVWEGVQSSYVKAILLLVHPARAGQSAQMVG